MSRRLPLFRSLAAAVALTVVTTGCGSDGSQGTPARSSGWTLADAQAFEDFPLYAPGAQFEDLPLTSVSRALDTSANASPVRANYVQFVYGSCDPGPDSGCAPPLSVQVWAACERNPGVYSPHAGQQGPVTIRGVPAYFYEGGRRLELSTGISTVVIFAGDQAHAERVAAALEGINNDVSAAEDLPPPSYTRQEGGVIETLPCPYDGPPGEVARAVAEMLPPAPAGSNQSEVVSCTESTAPAAAVTLDHYYDCAIEWSDGSQKDWCVLVRAENVFGTYEGTCFAAADAGWPGDAALPAGEALDKKTARWAVYAEEVCLRWHERKAEAIATLDDEMLALDLSYVWSVLRPYEAGLVRELEGIREPTKTAREVLSLYARRLELIDRGLEEFRRERKQRGVALFDRATKMDLLLTSRFEAIAAPACAPF